MTIGKRLPASKRPQDESALEGAANGRPATVPGDRLGAAAWLIGAAAGLVVMAITVAAVDGIRGMEKSSATQRLFYRSLGLSEPALTSAGRRPPNHALRSSTIDWRYQPLLPQQDPALIRLLATESLAGTKAPLP